MDEKTLYRRLVSIIEIPVIETSDIRTKGLLLTERGAEPKIYIKKGLDLLEKSRVLLHEYVHYIHLKKFYENENRAESEIIAESSVFFIFQKLGLATLNEPVLTEFTQNPDRIEYLSLKIQLICEEIIAKL